MSPKNTPDAGLRDQIVQALITHSITESNGGRPPLLRPSLLPPFVREKVEGNAASRADAVMDVVAPALAAKDARIAELEELPTALYEALAADRDQTRRARDRYRDERNAAYAERDHLRARLAETRLADEAFALQAEIADALHASVDECARCKVCDEQVAAAMTKVAPVLAAKDKRIAELEKRLPYWVSEFMDAHRLATRSGELVKDLKAEIAALRAQLAATTAPPTFTPEVRHAATEAVLALIIAKHNPDLAGHCGTGDGPAVREDATDYTNAVLSTLNGGA